MKILVVDDNADNLQVTELWLKREGYEVASASNGAEALEKLHNDKFGLIISDVLMPVMDGLQLCRKVNTDDGLRSIPFVFYTATYVDKQDEELALKAGASRFIRRPSDMIELMAVIKGLYGSSKEGHHETKLDIQSTSYGPSQVGHIRSLNVGNSTVNIIK